ncbi:putative ABC transporter [Klebsiella pneumoniae]|uniref:Putative ABC transporter n=1 Tax=Klebsiella pneumoniae TaxID=573 RepID=A0A2X3BYN1_KLEPN|nr:putative ABC transporter [Klebsiella pneumoniae]
MISRTNSDLQQVHTLLQMCPVPLAVFTYYIAGIAVMLWMSPAMTLIVVCVLACLAITALRARRRVFAQTGLASDRLANLTEHMREVLAQISVVKSCVAELRETRWLIASRGRLCMYASAQPSRRRYQVPPCWRYRCSGKSFCCATAAGRSYMGGSISEPSWHLPASSRC